LWHPPERVRVRPGRATGAQPALPSSKYYTLRYVLAAFLAGGESFVRDPALSDDTDVLVAAVRAFGAEVAWDSVPTETAGGEAAVASPVRAAALRVRGCAGRPCAPAGGVIQAGNAGAVLRLLLGIGALVPEVRFETSYPDSLGRRPNADLLDALAQLGIASEARQPGGLLPISLRGGPPRGGAVQVSGARSSQYLSALLYLGPLLAEGLRITVTEGLKSVPLVHATLRALAAASVDLDVAPDLLRYTIPGGQRYRTGTYVVAGDSPSAAALAAAALALSAPLQLQRLDPVEEDVHSLLVALDALGAPVALATRTGEVGVAELHVRLAANAQLRGARVDGSTCIDSVPALAAAACFAEGESRFEQVANLRLKESDRIGDLCAELTRAGCEVTAEQDAIVVRGRPAGIEGGMSVSAHQDHRLIQALAVVALHSRQGLVIEGAHHVAKSYPWFFEDLAAMGAVVEPLAASD
jgi:3-phosphoshikimate 1-carboxyvinyltransferase